MPCAHSQVDERLQAALQAGCDRYAPGIEIISVRITKPRIPSAIMDNYVEMENQRTRALVAAERHKVALLEAQTERQKAVAEVGRLATGDAVGMLWGCCAVEHVEGCTTHQILPGMQNLPCGVAPLPRASCTP